MPARSVNPFTEKEIARYAYLSPQELDERLGRAASAFEAHRHTSFAERAEKMNRLASRLESDARRLGEIMTREMGKPIAEAVAEVKKCALACRFYAEHAEGFMADEAVSTDAAKSYVAYQPFGAVLAVMPWNFPFWQVFRFAAPAVMAGNVGLLKHASNVMGCAVAIEDLFRQAGFDADEFQSLIISSDAVEGVIADPRVQAATVTGSTAAGRSVGAAAGKHLKPSVLELGGSDAFIVLADADIERAVELGVRGRMQNNAQSCIAAKRFIVEAPVARAFCRRFVERMKALRLGDPMDENTEVGPLARADLREEIHDQVERALGEGAKLLTGGEIPGGTGYFYPPTVIEHVKPGMVPFEEEIFGPVASISIASDADHALELANATPFGLGGAVFTEDLAKGEAVALRLEAGCAFVNSIVKSDPRMPFGGIKGSGYGRELSSQGLRAFVNTKTVWID